jgi:protoheme ferro-lyase
MFEWVRHWRYGNQYGYEKYFRQQDRKPVGKPGIILAELGMPEDFDPGFYTKFMDHVFVYSLPGFIQPLVLADRGIALIDPANPLAREEFKPATLVDMHGSYANKRGKPYIECEVTWRPPGMKKNPYDHGYFLYTGDGKGGAPDICQKTAAKVAGWYYGHLLPEKKVAWEYQCRKIYEESAAALKARYPEAVFRHARYIYRESLSQAVETLLADGCDTIIYQSFCNPVYSDFEDYAMAVPMVHGLVNGRAKVICADQPGNQPAMREAFAMLALDNLSRLPSDASLLLILSKHGHPFRKETQDKRGHEYRLPLERAMREVMKTWKGKWDLVWSDDEYADEYWDPRNKKFSTYAAYRKAIEEGYDYALEVPTDFIAENTDLMFFHAIKKFRAFKEFDPYTPVPYPDWDKPLTRVFREGKTTGIYAGCPVGPYRSLVAEAVSASVSEILENQK